MGTQTLFRQINARGKTNAVCVGVHVGGVGVCFGCRSVSEG